MKAAIVCLCPWNLLLIHHDMPLPMNAYAENIFSNGIICGMVRDTRYRRMLAALRPGTH